MNFKKFSLAIITIFFNFSAKSACPNLEGLYKNCYSTTKKIDGEYKILQSIEDGIDTYSVEFNDQISGEHRFEKIKTDSELMIKKEAIPNVGITVKLEFKNFCENNKVISIGDAYYFGVKVGTFKADISKEDEKLVTTLQLSYLGTETIETVKCGENLWR